MEEWYLEYFDHQQNRTAQSRLMDTRADAISQGQALERQACIINFLIGPAGKIPWEEVRPKT
jgi:hypothetical protein